MSVPALETANLGVIKSESFTDLKVLFDGPASAVDLSQGEQGGVGRSPDQDGGEFSGIVETAANEQPTATIVQASMEQRQTSPIKELFALGARTGREAVPIARAHSETCNTGDIPKQGTGACLHTDDLG